MMRIETIYSYSFCWFCNLSAIRQYDEDWNVILLVLQRYVNCLSAIRQYDEDWNVFGKCLNWSFVHLSAIRQYDEDWNTAVK